MGDGHDSYPMCKAIAICNGDAQTQKDLRMQLYTILDSALSISGRFLCISHIFHYLGFCSGLAMGYVTGDLRYAAPKRIMMLLIPFKFWLEEFRSDFHESSM